MRVEEIWWTLEEWFPSETAEEWDHIGLLLGDPRAEVRRIMTCLTVTMATAREAIAQSADLIVAHHPILFRPVHRLTADGPASAVLALARAGCAVISPHTAFDNGDGGINEQLAHRLSLRSVTPLVSPPRRSGRWGRLEPPRSLSALAEQVRRTLQTDHVDLVGDPDQVCHQIGIACGSAFDLAMTAQAAGCDAFITGEAKFHQCLEAEASGLGLVLAGHYASERFAVETLALRLAANVSDAIVWASQSERDPVRRL